jgi:hypothetical protein
VNRGLLEVILFTENASVPVLDTANICVPDDPMSTLPKEIDVGDREIVDGFAWLKEPIMEMVDGLPGALWKMDNVEGPLSPALPVGVNVTVMVPAAPGASVRLVGETVNMKKLEVMRLTKSVSLPTLEIVSRFTPDDPEATSPNDSEVEESEMAEAVPVPDSDTVDGLPVALWERANVPV